MNQTRPIIQLSNIVKTYPGGVTAVKQMSLDIHEGEFFALLGPSGCGKTTLLRMIAGFEIPTKGEVTIDGQSMNNVEPNHRPVNMVFQSYAVFPHMTVAENVGYGLAVSKTPKSEIQDRVSEALELVQLGDYGKRKPDQLSGGQRQRVALARALIKRPKVLLLDEPLSALDAKLREAMQMELVKLQQAVGITFVIFTHDQDEALSMADRIAVMEHGEVRQIAPPTELYENPKTRFVADFIGKMNLFEGHAKNCDVGRISVELPNLGAIEVPGAVTKPGVIGVAVRPEKMQLFKNNPAGSHISFQSIVTAVAYHGSESHVFVRTDSGVDLSATLQNANREQLLPTNGDTIWIGWTPENTLVLEQ